MKQRPEVNWVQTVGGGLAAMSSAVLLSTIGVAGTLVGAAVGSVVVTVGGALYSHFLGASRERVAAMRRNTTAMKKSHRSAATPGLLRLQEEMTRVQGQAQQTRPVPSGDGSWREVLAGLRWRRLLTVSLAIFVVVMGTIVSFEMMTGRALSSYTGGTQADGPRASIPLPSGLGRDRQPPAPTDPEQTPDETSAPDQEGVQAPADDGAPSPAEQSADAPQVGQPGDGSGQDSSDGSAPKPRPSTQPTSEPTTEPTTAPTTAPPETTQPSPASAPSPAAQSTP